MIIGILKETAGENRVAMLPENAAHLKKMQVDVLIEQDAGLSARARDKDYAMVGVEVCSHKEVISRSDLLLLINPPGDETIPMLKPGQIVIGTFQAVSNFSLIKKLAEMDVTSFSMEMMPRITRAQSMDVLSSMATVAGYKAVIEAASTLPYFFPMLMTAAGTIKPARVLILGAGVAGLQAIAIAKKLGAVVEAFDVRSEVKEQVESLGARFVEVEGAREDAAAGGYAVEQTEEFKKKQAQLIHDHAVNSDVIIATAQIPGRKAPILITRETVEAMAPVSVIIDLAASSGGNCELTKDNQTITHNQVTIIGNSNYPSDMPSDASKMYGNNLLNFLKLLISKDGQLTLDFNDEIIKGVCITYQKQIVNERILSLMKNQ